MSKKKELAKNTIIILTGKFCTQFLSFFLLPLYTAFLSSKEYGTVDLITTYVSLIVPIITLQVEMGIFRELIDSRNNENYTKKIISSGIFTIFIQFLLCLIIYIVINLLVNIPFSIYIVFNVFAIMLSNVLLQIARGFGDNLSYSIGSTIAGVTTILFNIFFIVILKWNIEGMLLSTALANFITALFMFFKLKLYKYLSHLYINKKILKKIIKYSLPLVPNGLIWWVINVSDRTIITIFLGAAANGIYAISNKFSSVLIQIYNVFNLSWTESASLHINDKDRDSFFSDTFNTILKLFSSVCLMLIALLPIFFNWLINKNYNESYIYVPILLLGMIFNIVVAFIGCIYVAKKMTKQVAMTSFWSGIINILINLILIKPIGIYAAAISTVISFAIMAIYRIKDVKKYIKLKVDIKLVFSLIILFIIECLIYYIKILPLSIINCIILTVILIILNKEFILAILSQIHKIMPITKKDNKRRC